MSNRKLTYEEARRKAQQHIELHLKRVARRHGVGDVDKASRAFFQGLVAIREKMEGGKLNSADLVAISAVALDLLACVYAQASAAGEDVDTLMQEPS